MLYRIEGTSVKIAGATSSAPLEQAQAPGWLRHVFDAADQWVFATDSEGIDPADLLLPAYQSLTVLSFFDAVAAQWRQAQLEGRPAKLKPWVVSARLCVHLAKLLAPGAEPLLLAEAKRRPAPPRFLETPREWVAAFDAVSLEDQLDHLERVVTFPEETAAFEVAFHEAWTTHNLETMERLLETQRQRQPKFFQHSLADRNQRWLPGLTQIIDATAADKRRPDTLMLVEVRHLCGPQGIPALLTNASRTLTRLL